ncbi:hypothetical protein [Notoacmeibacter marinus]|uniref:hypothetical protein n=1 Tax=Notoacmeibacter marinus TaxID=1876515 RepID=UPI00117B2D4B|nr:hypothetical protein [Notoacmeibacter marinus]
MKTAPPQEPPKRPGQSGPPPEQTIEARTPPTLTIDWDRYAAHLDDWDGTDEEKQEFLETLFAIIAGFVDLGFRLHPLQQCEDIDTDAVPDPSSEPCGPNEELRRIIATEMLDSDMLSSIAPSDLPTDHASAPAADGGRHE